RRMPPGCRELGEKLRMSGMLETGAIEHALGDRIGDDRTGPSGGDVTTRLTNRGDRGARTGMVRPAGPRRRGMAGGHDRQGVRECIERIFGANVGEPEVEPEFLCPVSEEVAIAEQVE